MLYYQGSTRAVPILTMGPWTVMLLPRYCVVQAGSGLVKQPCSGLQSQRMHQSVTDLIIP